MKTETGPGLSGRAAGFAVSSAGAGAPNAGVSVSEAPTSGALLASSAKVHACWAALSASICAIAGAAGARFGANSRGCEISTGATSPRAMITRTPSLVVLHNCRAKASGRRMQPCEAG